jgi:hypothetical protein
MRFVIFCFPGNFCAVPLVDDSVNSCVTATERQDSLHFRGVMHGLMKTEHPDVTPDVTPLDELTVPGCLKNNLSVLSMSTC